MTFCSMVIKNWAGRALLRSPILNLLLVLYYVHLVLSKSFVTKQQLNLCCAIWPKPNSLVSVDDSVGRVPPHLGVLLPLLDVPDNGATVFRDAHQLCIVRTVN